VGFLELFQEAVRVGDQCVEARRDEALQLSASFAQRLHGLRFEGGVGTDVQDWVSVPVAWMS
jgi:hypothetical protein